MAIYRRVHLSFWTDTKVDEDFTPEDKYFYLYLLTNPHTKLCGCYEIGFRQMARETGYNEETIARLVRRMEEVHKVLAYNKETKELLLIHWGKYNWSKSPKVTSAVMDELADVKTPEFREFIEAKLSGDDTVSIQYQYSMDTSSVSVTDTVTVINNTKSKPIKHRYGEYQNVLLTDAQMEKLKKEFPDDWQDRIEQLSGYMKSKGATYKDHLATIRNWNRRDKKRSATSAKKGANYTQREFDYDAALASGLIGGKR